MLQPDADLLEPNVQLNLLTFRQKLIAKLHVAGRSAEQPDGLFGQFYHLSIESSMPSSLLAGSTVTAVKTMGQLGS